MGKPIKEWGVVQFLSRKLPKAAGDIATNVADVVVRGESPVKAVMDVVRGEGGKALTKEDIAEAVELAEKDHQEYLAELRDRQSARQLQIAAIKSKDPFVRRFLYYLTTGLVVFSFATLLLLCFVEIPQQNAGVVFTAVGTLFGSALGTIVAYFYGSSSRDEDKDSLISTLMQRVK